MVNGTAVQRAEIRRLTAWFDHDFYYEVTGPLLFERMQKRIVHRQPPDGGALREAMKAANNHLDYVDYPIDHSPWRPEESRVGKECVSTIRSRWSQHN